jgi:O-antigen ligase
MAHKSDKVKKRQAGDHQKTGRSGNNSEAAAMSSLDRIWFFLVGAFFVLLPFVVSTSGFESFDVPKNGFLSISVAVLALFGLISGRMKLPLSIKGVDILLLSVIGYVALHSLISGKIVSSFSGIMAILSIVILYFILRSISSRKFHQYIWLGIAVSMALNALFTILQQFDMFPLMAGSGRADASDRLVPAGFIGEVNRGGFLFALTLIILLYFLFSGRKQKTGSRIFVLSLAVFILSGLVFTRTMTSILGLSACLLLWIIFHNWFLVQKQQVPLKKVMLFWLIVVIGLSGITALSYRAGVAERVQGLTKMVERGDWVHVTSGRTPMFFLTWEMIKKSPIVGNGLNSFPIDFFKFKTETEIGKSVRMMPQPGAFKEVHNEYLQTWLELGIVGLILLLLVFILPFYYGIRFMFRAIPNEDIYWIAMLLLGLIFSGITCLAFFPLHLAVTAPYICLVVAGLASFSGESPASTEKGTLSLTGFRGAPWLGYGAAFIIVIFSIWAGYSGINTWRVNKEVGMASYILTRSMSEPLEPRQKMLIIKEALFQLEELGRKNPQMPEIHNLKGTAFLLMGRFEESVKSFREAITLSPAPEAYVNLATAYLALGKNSDAMACLETARAYELENLKVLQLMYHMWSQDIFSREQGLKLIQDLEKWNTIGPNQAVRMLKDLRDKGRITREEFSDLAARERKRGN